MKFEQGSHFFKHKNCMDAFICVMDTIQDTGNKAILRVDWMCQGIETFWSTPIQNQRIFIKDNEYDNWVPYVPKGKYYGS